MILIADNGIERENVLNGPGIRTVIYTQHCIHHCKGCHNPNTWSKDGGKLVTAEELIIAIREDFLSDGVTFSGGDPMLQARELLPVARAAKQMGKNIWIYTGFTVEELAERNDFYEREFLRMADTVVDGQFIEELKFPEVPWRGSRNQRIVDGGKLMLALAVVTY